MRASGSSARPARISQPVSLRQNGSGDLAASRAKLSQWHLAPETDFSIEPRRFQTRREWHDDHESGIRDGRARSGTWGRLGAWNADRRGGRDRYRQDATGVEMGGHWCEV